MNQSHVVSVALKLEQHVAGNAGISKGDRFIVYSFTSSLRIYLRRLNQGNDQPDTAYYLHSADAILWSIDTKDLLAFNWSNWTHVT
jgi:hypothetical protein